MQTETRPSSCRLLELFKAGVFVLLALFCHRLALADGPAASTHFSYGAPNASSVGLAGEFNSWKPAPMAKGADGTWTIDVPLTPGEYGYKFVVNDNDWELDPNNTARKTVNGTENSSITVPATPAATGTAADTGTAAASGTASPTETPAPAMTPAAAASPDAGTLFTYSNPSANSVFVAGQFNNWDTSATPMQKDSAGLWSVRVPLVSGSYQYKLFVDGAWMLDPGNTQQADDGTGNQNSLLIVGAAGAASSPSSPAETPAAGMTEATPAPPEETNVSVPAEDSMSLGKIPIKPGDVMQFDIPLPLDTWRQTFLSWPQAHGEPRIADDMRLKPTGVHVGLAVPQNFNPEKRWPLLIVCGGGGGSSVDQLNSFYEVAGDAGWVAIATDAKVDHSSDSNLIRWAGLQATIDYLHKKWPASKQWPVAVAGFDGGAYKAGYLAAMLTRRGFNVIGIWLGGLGDDSPSKGMHEYNPPHVRYLHTPLFLSSGKQDKDTNPVAMRLVYRSFEASGFLRLKLGVFPGTHEVDADQVRQGLDWFIETVNAHPTLEE